MHILFNIFFPAQINRYYLQLPKMFGRFLLVEVLLLLAGYGFSFSNIHVVYFFFPVALLKLYYFANQVVWCYITGYSDYSRFTVEVLNFIPPGLCFLSVALDLTYILLTLLVPQYVVVIMRFTFLIELSSIQTNQEIVGVL
ncbi:unnamed protein product [Caenorhabditis auriculariae]|uniref:Uncharacterized protein n=1 Tax=Caenorhabditis auriculariae TaxID=2777116 RepID=A0A8S1GQ16_9PELO|nr:unnamed protein product [Caenorhabditis auriculariae]